MSGTRRDRYGNLSMASRAKPKEHKPRRGHEIVDIHTEHGMVWAVCKCGHAGIMQSEGAHAVELAARDGDLHVRGLGGGVGWRERHDERVERLSKFP